MEGAMAMADDIARGYADDGKFQVDKGAQLRELLEEKKSCSLLSLMLYREARAQFESTE